MKKKFSKAWIGSKQPRKQRKFRAKAPLHLKKKMLSVNLSKDLRKKYGTRNVIVRKGDTVKIMRGKFKKKQGKVSRILTKMERIYVEGIQVKKMDGSKSNVPLRASNLQIFELDLNDKKRAKKLGAKPEKKTEETKKEESKIKDKENKK